MLTNNTDRLESGQTYLVDATNDYHRALLGTAGVDLSDKTIHLSLLNPTKSGFARPKEGVFVTPGEFENLLAPTGDGNPWAVVK
jgi:hypothetical protein